MEIIFLLTLLLFKHAVADLFLQTLHWSSSKTKYFSYAHRHYFEHGILTFVVCLIFVNWKLAFAMALLDYVAHWHIDFTKSHVVKYFNVDRTSGLFLRIQTVDQILHYTTYAAITFILTLQ